MARYLQTFLQTEKHCVQPHSAAGTCATPLCFNAHPAQACQAVVAD